MGQYWLPVNLDKCEFIDPHKLGTGLKLWEQLANHPGTGAALTILCAAMPEPRGGGDLNNESEVAKRTIGRWAGDRIALVGDYAEEGDLPGLDTSKIHSACDDGLWTDITDDVCAVIEKELEGKFTGTGWRDFDTEIDPSTALKTLAAIHTHAGA
jgi:hypothetical protein